MAEFTERHVGKAVRDQDGGLVGQVTGIENGSFRVTLDAAADQEVVDHLGWGGRTNQETHVLNDRYVSNIDDDTVRLRV